MLFSFCCLLLVAAYYYPILDKVRDRRKTQPWPWKYYFFKCKIITRARLQFLQWYFFSSFTRSTTYITRLIRLFFTGKQGEWKSYTLPHENWSAIKRVFRQCCVCHVCKKMLSFLCSFGLLQTIFKRWCRKLSENTVSKIVLWPAKNMCSDSIFLPAEYAPKS